MSFFVLSNAPPYGEQLKKALSPPKHITPYWVKFCSTKHEIGMPMPD